MLFPQYGLGSRLTDAINETLKNEKNLYIKLKPSLLKVEQFFRTPNLTNHHNLFKTEFINFSLRNPFTTQYNRYPFKRDSVKSEIQAIENKVSNFSPIARMFALQIVNEVKYLNQTRLFKNYINLIEKSYYFTSKDLIILDKKMRLIEPWWNSFLNSSSKEINKSFNAHLEVFFQHFEKSVIFMLNSNLETSENNKLNIFAGIDKTSLNHDTIEEKIDAIILSSDDNTSTDQDGNEEESELTDGEVTNDIELGETKENNDAWAPKDNLEAKVQPLKNYNLPKSYPRPSPNYIKPQQLPIPINDW